jgi:hypothetical protein
MRFNRRSHVSFQPVEPRRMLSGNVDVAFDGQLLDVRGDNLNNNIVIAQQLSGAIVVTGQFGTLINGLPSVRFANGLSIEKLDVRMEGGDDRVAINRLNLAGDLNADLGINSLGRDTLVVNNSTIQGNLFGFGGFDTDTINVNGTTVFGDAIIDLAEGSGRSTVNNSTFNGSATFVGGEGADVFNAIEMTVGLSLNVDAKQGADVINHSLGSAMLAAYNTDLGADRITLSDLTILEDLIVESGGDNDTVSITSVNSGKNLVVNLDSGNDTLTVASSSAGQDAILVGGAGVDRLVDLGLTGGTKKEVIEFEILS